MKILLLAALLLPTVFAQGLGGRGGPPPAAKVTAPFDPTGYWVSEIVDEWRFRITPQKGDIPYMPINAEARRIANAWDPDKDASSGNACKAYGAIGVMQRPGRLHVTWADDNTLKMDLDAGTQTRVFKFGSAAQTPPGEATWQGNSTAQWQVVQQRGAPATQGPHGTLKAVTTNMKPGYLRKNGVPYSERAVQTEYINYVAGQKNDEYLVDTAMVDDPVYLNGPFIRTYTFKKEADGSKWDPAPCWNR
jgi:hypothetical protein